jgi:exopolysaccharide biosynthesis polyprenyl glycosylphosphotransferase
MSMKALAPGRRSLADGETPELRPHPPTTGQASSLRVRVAHLLLQEKGWTATRLAFDSLLLALAVGAARLGAPTAQIRSDGELLALLFPVLVLATFGVRRMYSGELQVRVVDGLGEVIAATSLVAASLIALAAFTTPQADAAPLIARVWLFATLYLLGGRALLAWSQRRARVSGLIGKPAILVGAGRIGAQVERRLREQPELGLRPVGYLDADPPPAEMAPDREAPLLGHPSELGQVVEATGARHVVLGFTSGPDSLLMPLVRECEARGLEISMVPRLFESVNVRVGLEHIGGLPLFGLRTVDPKGWQFAVKHGLDRVAAAVALVVLSPLLLAVALAVKVFSPGPVLFRQRRIGRDGRDFEMLKFRSMRVAAEAPREARAVDPASVAADTAPGGVEGRDRRTRVGSFIRSTSLDELPQLLNVLSGQMSLVGPRPERPEFVELFGQSTHRYDDRHRVKSGVTGWAQVHDLRGKTSLSDRIEWDNHYIENWSLSLDVKILLMTIAAVLRRVE